MSTECIELESSDDEVQLVEEIKLQKPKETKLVTLYNVYPVNNAAPSYDAIQKLTRNSNIDLTINIDGNDSKESLRPPISGATNRSFKRKIPKENTPVRNGAKIVYPDIVVIDDQEDVVVKSEGHGPSRTHSTPFKRTQNASHLKSKNQPAVNKIISPLNPLDNKSPSPSVIKDPIAAESLKKKPFRQSVVNNTPPSSASKKPIDKILSDIVYIIDDDEVERAPKSLKTTPKLVSEKSNGDVKEKSVGLSHTEVLVNSFREKIKSKLQRESFTNITNRPTKRTEDTSEIETSALRVTTGKKRVNPDRLAVDDANIVNSKFRARTSVSSSVSSDKTPTKSASGSKNTNQPAKQYAIENMFSGLVSACIKIFSDNAPSEEKLWGYFKRTSDEVLRSSDFINALKEALKSMEDLTIKSLDDKLIAMQKVKEVIRIMKRQPEVVNRKIKKLTKTLNIISSRIKKLEETEVTSDEEDENIYVLLDRYRTKAAKIYEKICELQGSAADAGRVVRQRFRFSGSGKYPKIEQALEKYYNKTRRFPDFFDVQSLVEATAKKENLDIPPDSIHNIAQTLFIEFGNKLKRMRCYDEYMSVNDYLEEGNIKDPALDNEDLYKELQKLDSTTKISEGEQRVFNEFVIRQAEAKSKSETKGQDSDHTSSDGESEVENKDKKENLEFSDTDDELINDNMQRKRKRSPSVEGNAETGPNKNECTFSLGVAGPSNSKEFSNNLSSDESSKSDES